MSRECPNGHALAINVVLPPGAGRDYCPSCGWTDADNPENAQRMVELQRDNTAGSGAADSDVAD
jgi:hypothetical protein